MMTQGCEYNIKEVPVAESVKSYQRVELHLIDIAGQNIFKEITFELLGKASLIMLVYDVTNPDTFTLLRQWLEGIKQQNQGRPLLGVVVANKTDLENRAAVGPLDGMAFAKSIGFEFFEVSTLQGKNIDEPFKCLAE
jgi:GTPase SAR1 family protein